MLIWPHFMSICITQVRRPAERKRLKRAGDNRQANDADEMRAELFGDGKGCHVSTGILHITSLLLLLYVCRP